jgi:hypothetical protein
MLAHLDSLGEAHAWEASPQDLGRLINCRYLKKALILAMRHLSISIHKLNIYLRFVYRPPE